MPRTCTVCRHAQSRAIDQALIAGETFRYVSQRYGLSLAALVRHRDDHIPATLRRSHDEQDLAHAIDLVAQFKAVNSASIQVLHEARQVGDGELTLKAIDRVVRQLELVAKASGEIDDRPQVSVFLSPEWGQIHAVMMEALAPHLEARVAVAAALMALEQGGERSN